MENDEDKETRIFLIPYYTWESHKELKTKEKSNFKALKLKSFFRW